MRVRTGIRIAVGVAVAAGLVWTYGQYDTITFADKACLRARVGEPAEPARAHLRTAAAARDVEVRETGERTSAGFRSLIDGAPTCCMAARSSMRSNSSTRSTPGWPKAPRPHR